jgi:uncharacterized hydrophobic protein (TIGR00341 family)
MALRLIEITVPEIQQSKVRTALADLDVISLTFQSTGENQTLARVLIETVKSEPVLDHLEKNFALEEGFRITLLPVEGTLPRPQASVKEPNKRKKRLPQRINRTELLDDLSSGFDASRIFILTIFLSFTVAAVGILRDDVAIIIGAMVIAPLLTPNMALALGTTLGDIKLVRQALKTNVIGFSLTLLLAIILGMFIAPDTELAAIKARTQVSFGDLVLALAAGSAGALAFTTGVSAGLVGVMVAVALMPPLVVCGLLIGAKQFSLASGALLLVATNVICVNLTGVLTFLLQGIRPKTWWETGRAKKATRIAIFIWGGLFISLILLLLFAPL